MAEKVAITPCYLALCFETNDEPNVIVKTVLEREKKYLNNFKRRLLQTRIKELNERYKKDYRLEIPYND